MLSVPTTCPKLKHKCSGGEKDNLALHAWHAADLGHCICTHSISLSVACEEKEKKKWCYFFSFTPSLWDPALVAAFPRSAKWQYQHFPAHTEIVYNLQHSGGFRSVKFPVWTVSVHTPPAKPLPKQPAPTWDVTTRKSGQKFPYNHHLSNRLHRAGQELSSKCRKKTEELLSPVLKPGQKQPHRETPTLVVLKKFISALFNPYYCSVCMFVQLRLEFWLLEALRAAIPAWMMTGPG